MKTCTGCRRSLPPEAYYRRKDARDGLQTRCKACRDAAHAAYVAAHHEEICTRKRAYVAAHREGIRAYQATYRAAHREERRARGRAAYAARREQARAAAQDS